MFAKGEKVALVGPWDNKGIFCCVLAEVYACGKKQMVLNRAGNAADCLGRNFLPGEKQYGAKFVMRGHDAAAIEAAAFAAAIEYRANELARYEACIARAGRVGGDGYVRAIEKDIAALKAAAPAVVWK